MNALFQMTVSEAAKELDISESLLRMYLRKGVFKKAYKFAGTRWVLDRNEIEQFKAGTIEVKGCFSKRN